MDATRAPTLADVAAAAAISISTASRALRDSPQVSEVTRLRVQSIAGGLGFEPNRLARSLRTRSSSLVGVVVPDVGNAFYAAALKAAQDELERDGFGVLVMNTEREPRRETESLRVLRAHGVDGMLVASSGGFESPGTTPVVFFDHVPDDGGACVAPANRQGIGVLTEHVAGHGHDRIGFVSAPPGLTSADERLRGFRAFVAENALHGSIAYGDERWSAESGERATRELLSGKEPPTAIVAAGDTFALGALRALHGLGIRVPDDVALVSFDDPPDGDLLDPPLTALTPHAAELGRSSARLLLDLLGGGGPEQIRVELELEVRVSCGCRP